MKKSARIFCFVLAAAVCCLFPFAVSNLPEFSSTNTPKGIKGVLELWHIETFEGGIGSRAEWLRKRALEFERANKGLYVNVSALTVEQMQQRLEENEKFHIISFSAGVGEKVKHLLSEFSGKLNVRDDLAEYGRLNGKQVAVPYMLGGYCLFARETDVIKVSGFSSLTANAFNSAIDKKIGKYSYKLASIDFGRAYCNIPALPLALSAEVNPPGGIEIGRSTQYSAYEGFLSGTKSTILLGTQRDFYKLNARMDNNTIGRLRLEPLKGFSDLVQYAALHEDMTKEQMLYAQKFIEHICSDGSQAKITSLSMFSVNGQKIYSDNIMELALMDRLISVNVFSSMEILENLFNDCAGWLNGTLSRQDLLSRVK